MTQFHHLVLLGLALQISALCGFASAQSEGLLPTHKPPVSSERIDLEPLLIPAPSDPGSLLNRGKFVPAIDPGFVYSEFVNATFDASGASFDRLTVPWLGALNSPGTRISFRTDAIKIELNVVYGDTFSTPGCGKFRLEIDGILQSQLFGSDTAFGIQTYTLVEQAGQGPHNYCVMMPYGSDVKFAGMTLFGGTKSLAGTPPPRPNFLYAAYGDSITHGFDASSIGESYPFRLGSLRDWRVINMGFKARRVAPADGLALGALGANCITLAIGLNDYFGPTPTGLAAYKELYKGLLDNIRSVQPSVPIFAITPTWVAFEGVDNVAGLSVENYRQVIREEVIRRKLTDSNLYLVDGLGLVPGGIGNFPDGIHPSDSGFNFYANSLNSIFQGVFGPHDSTAPALPRIHEPTGKPRPESSSNSYSEKIEKLEGYTPRRRESLLSEVGVSASEFGLHSGGRAGLHGTPSLRVSALPRFGSEVDLLIGNSSGKQALSYISISISGVDQSGSHAASLSGASLTSSFIVPTDGLRLRMPLTPELQAGSQIWMQLVQLDDRAVGGVSLSRPCSIRFGY